MLRFVIDKMDLELLQFMIEQGANVNQQWAANMVSDTLKQCFDMEAEEWEVTQFHIHPLQTLFWQCAIIIECVPYTFIASLY